MIRRILLILIVLAVPAGLASASQSLADNANPSIPHQHPIVVELGPETEHGNPTEQAQDRGDDG